MKYVVVFMGIADVEAESPEEAKELFFEDGADNEEYEVTEVYQARE